MKTGGAKKWTAEHDTLLHEIKGKSAAERFRIFNEVFPGFTNKTGLLNRASRIGAVVKKCPRKGHTKARPLYSEQFKKGYVRIKVAQPSTWWQKSKWVWVATHPGEPFDEKDCYYFMDGDNRNFAPDNIEKLGRHEITAFQQCGGIVPGQPELSRLNLLRARLKLAQLDAGEKIGEVVTQAHYRVFREERNAKARERNRRRYATDPEYRQKIVSYAKANRERIKSDPERLEKRRRYQREWARKKRGKR